MLKRSWTEDDFSLFSPYLGLLNLGSMPGYVGGKDGKQQQHFPPTRTGLEENRTKMADEEDTREVLFQDWEGPDKTGLTIEHTSGGELLVKEVKGESPAARSGKVYEGDQIVGATIYFENMSSEETAELLKTLNKHKVGLKLQNKGDKSPCYSPLSTPCRSPMGTLTWEGKSQFGASSPEIILSGDDEDYKRIYTKKIKPRLKSEDLAEGVDVRTERHSSTSSDGSTITTITRRITTYTVDMPSGIGEKLELSSPDFKGQQHESGDGSPRVRILHGSPTVKGVGEEGVFESCNVTYTGLKGSSTETHSSGDQSKTIIREGTEISKDLRFKGPKFGVVGHEGTKILRESEEQTAGSIDESEKQTISGESKSTFIKVVTVRGSGDAELTTNDDNKRSASLSLPQEDIKFQRPSGDTSLHLNKGSSYFDVKKVGNSADSGKVSFVTESNANTGYSSNPDRNSLTSRQTSLPSAKPKSGEKDDGVPTATKIGFRCPDINTERKEGDLKLPHINTSSLKTTSQGSSEEAIKYQKMDSDVDRSQVTDDGFHYKTQTITEIDTRSKGKADMSDSKVGVNVRMPEMNLNLKASTIKGNVDVERVRTAEADRQDFESKDGFSLSRIETLSVKSKDQEVDVRGKSSKTENDMEITEPKKNKDVKKYTEVEAPVLTIPCKSGTKISMPDVDINLKGPKLKGEMDVSHPKMKTDIKSPKIDIKGPEVDIEGTKGELEMPKLKMSSMKMKGPKVDVPDVNLNLKGPKVTGDMDVKLPKKKGDLKGPDVDIEGPDDDTEGYKGGLKMSKFKMPSIGIIGPKDEDPDVHINLPKADIDVKAQDVEIEGADLDIRGPDANLKGSKFIMPSISGPEISMPDVDFNLKDPKLKGDMNVSGQKVRGDVKSQEIHIKGPEAEFEGQKGGFEMPKIKMSSLNLKGSKVDVPDVNLNLKGPNVESDVDVELPKIKGDLKGPEVDIKGVDIDMKGTNAKLKGPKFNMPSISGQKISMPDVDFNLKGPKLKGNMDVSGPRIKGDIKSPEIDIKGPEVDIEGPKGGFEMPKLKMPSLNLKGPKVDVTEVDINLKDVDFNLKGPKLKGDMDISSPNLKGDIKSPVIDIKGAKVKTDVPSLDIDLKHISEPPKFPTIPVSKAALPNVDINLTGSKLKGGFKGEGQFPKADLKDTVLEVTPKKSKFKMPKVGFKSPKIKTSEPDIKLEHGDVNIKGKTGSCEGLDVDIGLSGSKSKSPKFKIPKFGLKGPKADMPEADLSKSGIDIKTSDVMTAGAGFDVDTHSGKLTGSKNVDLNLTGPQLKGDLNVSVPDVDLNLKEADIKGPKFEVEGPKGGLEMPKIKIPSFGIKLPQLENSNDTITIPNVNADTVTPKVDIGGVDVKGPEASPNVKLPSVSGPTLPDLNINLTGPKTKGNVNVALPNTNIDIKVPKTEIKGAGKITPPEVDIKGPHVDLGVGKDGFEIPKIKMPSLDFKGPKTGSQGVDINLSKPKIDVDSSKVDFKAPQVKLPTVSGPEWDINLKGSNVEGKEINVNLPKTDIEIKGPKLSMSDVDMNLKAPDVDIKDPKVQTGGPKVGFKMSKVTLPSESEVDVNFAKADFNIKAPEVNIKGPEFDSNEASLDVPDIDVKGKKGKFKLPKVKGKARKQEADIKTPEVDQGIDTPNIHVKGTNTKKPLFGKLHFPDVELDMKPPKLKGDGSLAEGFKSPDANVSSDSAKIYLEGPDVNVKGVPELSARTSGQSASGLQYPEGTILFPKIKVPKFGILLPKVEGQDVAGKGKSDAAMGGKLNLEGGSGVSLSAKGKSASLDLFKKSKHRSSSASDEGSLGASSPSALSEAECGDISIDVGGTKVKGKKGKLKFGTFGGFGSKSKGSYEVTLGNDNEGEIEGSTDASVPLKKSRLSSSSSSDSGSRVAVLTGLEIKSRVLSSRDRDKTETKCGGVRDETGGVRDET
ncbi:hypothetical protein CCH79_00012597, partial [Gambusia affinis]